jgi:hypothetical protein
MALNQHGVARLTSSVATRKNPATLFELLFENCA